MKAAQQQYAKKCIGCADVVTLIMCTQSDDIVIVFGVYAQGEKNR